MNSRDPRNSVARNRGRGRRTGGADGTPPGDLVSRASALVAETRRLRSQAASLADEQRALREANERFADLYDFVPVPYLIVSGVGVIKHVNESAVQFLGGAREWIVGRPLIGYVDTSHMRKVLDSVLGSSAGFSQSAEVRMRAHDGVRVAQVLSRRRSYSEKGAGTAFHIVILDLTEVRRLEEERRRADDERVKSQQAERIATAASEAKDDFLAMLSHELRTPLTPILAAADALVAHSALRGDVRSKIDIIRRNVKAEAHLIDDLLDVARITRKKLEINRRPVDLHRVLMELLDGWVVPFEDRQIALEIALKADSSWVHGDPGRLGQVFHNIIGNASKFTDAGGRISVVSEVHDGRVRVTIQDTGAGMTDSQVRSLFKPFQPAGEPGARRGLGLGLVISHAIVEAHDGTLDIWSPGPGSGTTVRLELPVIAAPSTVEEVRPVEAPAVTPASTVLLVEDDRDSAEMLAMLLSLEGFQVRTAASVHAATAMVGCCDVLVSDIALTDGSGLELMQRIRAKGSAMRGIALSGYGSAHDIQRSIEAGFEEHLTKPVDLERLVEAVRRLTDKKA